MSVYMYFILFMYFYIIIIIIIIIIIYIYTYLCIGAYSSSLLRSIITCNLQSPALFQNIFKFSSFLPKFSNIQYFALFQHFFALFLKKKALITFSSRISPYIYVYIYYRSRSIYMYICIYKFTGKFACIYIYIHLHTCMYTYIIHI